MKTMHAGMGGLVLLLVCLISHAGAGTYLSPEYLAVSPDGKTLYITAATSKQLVIFDLVENCPVDKWTLPCNPSGVAIAPDGTVYVTGDGVNGRLLKLGADGKVRGQVATGHTPMSPVVADKGKTVYVPNRFNNNVVAIDTDEMKIKATVAVLREPHAAILGMDDKLLFVANHLPACRATDHHIAAAVSVIDTATFQVSKQVLLPNGSTNVRGITATPNGQFIYVTHILGRYQLPTTQLERGWTSTAALSVVDGKSGKYINTVLLDDVDLGAANPWGVAVSSDEKNLIVAHSGTREVSVIDRKALHLRLDKAAKNKNVTDVTKSAPDIPNDLAFLYGIRQRVKLNGDGPRGTTVVNDTIYTSLYFTDALAKVNLKDRPFSSELVSLGVTPDLNNDRVRRGEMLWNDATICFQQWVSCSTCHPDGRPDGLNWDLMNDGIGNPKQSKNLVYSHLTPPTMITGIRPDMQACNRKGLTHILFAARPEKDALCLDAYVSSLKPIPSPYLVKGKLSQRAKEGEKIFHRAGCDFCHLPDKVGPNGERLFTDQKKHDIGFGTGMEKKREFDTTTLVETWRTAPYLYDGRALTIEEMLTTCNPHNTHGNTQSLTADELKALIEYVLSR